MKVTRYEVSEQLAKRAKQAYSFSDYVDETQTAEYNRLIERFENTVNELLNGQEPTAEVVDLADRYSKKLAYALDRHNEIMARVPSVMIIGAGHFPTRAKEKQNQAMDKWMTEYSGLLNPTNNYYVSKIKTALKPKEPPKEITFALDNEYPEVNGVKVVENTEVMRIQLIFDGKPDEQTRTLLKKKAFKWSPKFGAWQRQLTRNAIIDTKNLLKTIGSEQQ